jgi:ParB-like nuclease domain
VRSKNGKKVPVRGKPTGEEDSGVAPVEPDEAGVPEVPQGDDDAGIGPSGIHWRFETRRAGDLKEWERNPRRITDSQAKHLATSIIKFGLAVPITINADNRIIGGHQRCRVMLQAEMINYETLVPVAVASRQLDDEEHEELAIRLNKNTGTWDFDKLTAEFSQSDLRDWGFSPMDFGMVSPDAKAEEITKLEPELRPSNLKPSKPRTCTHCDQQCHCVVEE